MKLFGHFVSFIEFMPDLILKTPQNTQKSSQKSSQKILSLITSNPHITILEIAHTLNLSPSGVKKILKSLKDTQKLKRIGSHKGGVWEVC